VSGFSNEAFVLGRAGVAVGDGVEVADGSGARRWAAVTGASSGIGAAFARALSAEGYGVLLVARGGTALAAVAAGLPGPTEVLPADLATSADLARVEARLARPGEGRIGLLVNNAATGQWGPFAEQSPEELAETITVNATAAARLARAVLPEMVAAGEGGLITVSSPAGARPSPWLAAYGATKAFLDALDVSLRAELAAVGCAVTVTTVWPGWTRTRFHQRLGQDVDHVPADWWVSADTVACEVLRRHRLGHDTVRVPEPTLRQWVIDEARRVRRELPATVKAPMQTLARYTRRLAC
jgi:short-subunit dehydrogenase